MFQYHSTGNIDGEIIFWTETLIYFTIWTGSFAWIFVQAFRMFILFKIRNWIFQWACKIFYLEYISTHVILNKE